MAWDTHRVRQSPSSTVVQGRPTSQRDPPAFPTRSARRPCIVGADSDVRDGTLSEDENSSDGVDVVLDLSLDTLLEPVLLNTTGVDQARTMCHCLVLIDEKENKLGKIIYRNEGI
jgi:hypothetical protein